MPPATCCALQARAEAVHHIVSALLLLGSRNCLPMILASKLRLYISTAAECRCDGGTQEGMPWGVRQ